MNRAILLGVIGGAIAVSAAGGGAAYIVTRNGPSIEEQRAAAEAQERVRFAREEEVHQATVFSFLPSGRRDGGAQPVMVRLGIAGSNGLRLVCTERPRVEEALLRAFQRDGLRAPIIQVLNDLLPNRPVRSAQTIPMLNMMTGGRASYEMDRACREVVKS